jgi:hypothetical protein
VRLILRHCPKNILTKKITFLENHSVIVSVCGVKICDIQSCQGWGGKFKNDFKNRLLVKQ